MKNKEEWTSSLRGSDGDESPLIHQLRREASSEVFDNCWTVKALNSDEKHRGNPGRFFWADGTRCSRAASVVHVQQMIFLYNNLLFRSNNLSVYSQLSKWKIEYQLFITEEHSLITSEPQNRGLGPECRLGINQWDGGAEIRNQQLNRQKTGLKVHRFTKELRCFPTVCADQTEPPSTTRTPARCTWLDDRTRTNMALQVKLQRPQCSDKDFFLLICIK